MIGRLPPVVFAAVCSLLSLAASGPGQKAPSPPPKEIEREAILTRARRILEQSQNLEITTTQARRKVQLLLEDLRSWAEANDKELTARTRTFTTPAKNDDTGVLGTDSCPIFFGEEEDELCPLDQARSEVWGAEVLFCRYLCSR